MARALRHRGPDGSGVWCDPESGVALGHRRLAILDLSSAGGQPMHSRDGRFTLTFNGEIYNHLEIRRALERTGRAPDWTGHSDTETMVASFVEWGVEGAVGLFSGMFAFAVWDAHERSLHLARDRIGEKPLYYGWLGDSFVFGSELKALREHPQWDCELNRDALCLFMRHNYVPAPYTIYSGISKLLPGCLLRLEPRGKSVVRSTYWAVQDVIAQGVDAAFAGTADEAVEELDRLLIEATGEQMISDVPLGAFLSGGIDSSLVAALMQSHSTKPIRTFTVGFSERGYDEAGHARLVAAHLGTEHTELYVTAEDALNVVPELPTLYDEPFADSSQIPTFLVAKLARQSVTVALSGDGGDELFGGYDRYKVAINLAARRDRVPRLLRSAMRRAIEARGASQWDNLLSPISSILGGRWQAPGDKLLKKATLLGSDRYSLYRMLMSHWERPEEIVLGAAEPPTVFTDPRRRPKADSYTELMMAVDCLSYLPDDILVKVDRAAMGVSLETRLPLLNRRVVEFAWSLPAAIKFRGGVGKWMLREALYKRVPRKLVDRPKMGFAVPIGAWLRGPLRGWAEALLEPGLLRRQGLFDPEAISRKWHQHATGEGDATDLLWSALMFQSWFAAQQCVPRGGSGLRTGTSAVRSVGVSAN